MVAKQERRMITQPNGLIVLVFKNRYFCLNNLIYVRLDIIHYVFSVAYLKPKKCLNVAFDGL